ncbi:YggS family pyridoxal phosphate enzyme, partial [Candidatus Micrarchaeota archaeon CG11_big_fil_rev_8_21_14_0_20_47_5]
GEIGKIQEILLQVNASGEETKGGFANKEEVMGAIAEIANMKNVKLLGLMSIAPDIEAEKTRECFMKLRNMRNEIAGELKIFLPELSMGMTNDYLMAVQEGATIVRVGRKIIEPERT